jgi:putative phage-type endonuclease
MAFISLAQQGGDIGPEQGSPEWFENRKNKMTGSKPSSIMFDCTDEQSYNRLWAQYFGGEKPPEFDESQQAAVDWGSNNEDNAAMEFIKQMPGTLVYETSLIDHPVYKWMAASPDGYIVRLETENGEIKKPYKVLERAAFEIKCPGSRYRDHEGNVKPSVMMKSLEKKSNPPYYYMPQVHFEMVMLGTPVTYFYMWTPWYSKVWKINFDHDYWVQTVAVLKAFYEKEIPFECLLGKIQNWKQTSQAISRNYKTLQSFQHAPEGALEKIIEANTKPKISVKTDIKVEEITKFAWYNNKDLELLSKMYE